MKKIKFTKMVASGNDFIIVPLFHCFTASLRKLAKQICGRKYGAGADGMLLLEKSKKADVRMRIFNADGSEAAMCGNGARCVALYSVQGSGSRVQRKEGVTIETKAGIINSEVNGERVKIKLTSPAGMKLGIPLKVSGRTLRVNFINTGVPHAVIFVEGLKNIDVDNLGRFIRYHKKFAPAGANVDFVEVLDGGTIAIRTYERGVEGETLACGTGSAASALITGYRVQGTGFRVQGSGCASINVRTQSGEVLKVYFNRIGRKFSNVWLEGRAKIVYKGEYYV